jgi:polyisoprenoid-binding protein YceI
MFIRAVLIRVLIPILALTLATSAGAAETYSIDPVHSAVLFKLKHAGTANFWGRFNDFSGTIVLDEANHANSSVQMVVQSESIDTFNDKRNEHLRSPDFFNAQAYPDMKFESTAVKALDADTLQVAGNFTMLGTTRPITVTVEKTGASTNKDGKKLVGYEAKFSIKRSDFGMAYGIDTGSLGDDVEVTVSVEAGAQAPAAASN